MPVGTWKVFKENQTLDVTSIQFLNKKPSRETRMLSSKSQTNDRWQKSHRIAPSQRMQLGNTTLSKLPGQQLEPLTGKCGAVPTRFRPLRKKIKRKIFINMPNLMRQCITLHLKQTSRFVVSIFVNPDILHKSKKYWLDNNIEAKYVTPFMFQVWLVS